jgi:hypothetical protein
MNIVAGFVAAVALSLGASQLSAAPTANPGGTAGVVPFTTAPPVPWTSVRAMLAQPGDAPSTIMSGPHAVADSSDKDASVSILVTHKSTDAPKTSTAYQTEIADLNGTEARSAKAADALVKAGVAALPALHDALAGPRVSSIDGARIMRVLAAIGDVSSVVPVTQFSAARRDEDFVQKQALNALIDLPVSVEAQSFVDSQLINPRVHADVKRAALLYYAAHHDPRAMRWVIQYRSPGTDPAIRYTGLYLGAVLGDKSVMRWIVELLESGRPAYEQRYLLMGLAELLSPHAFERQIAGLELSPAIREEALRFSRSHRAASSGQDKTSGARRDIPPVARSQSATPEPVDVATRDKRMWPMLIGLLLVLAGIGRGIRNHRKHTH